MTAQSVLDSLDSRTSAGNYVTEIGLTTIANACAMASPVTLLDINVANSQTMILQVTTSAPLTPGVSTIVTSSAPGVGATASYYALGASCFILNEEQSASGTITIATVTSSEITGSFDIMWTGTTVAESDHVTGSFSAPICANFLAEFGACN